MIEIVIKNFQELHRVLEKYRDDKRWIFRGHSNPEWKLQPKIGRDPYCGVDEKMVFESWKRAAVEFIKIIPESDWEWLSIAQHHGLATRLLDWTTNPLNACFFSVREPHNKDSIVYAGRFRKNADDKPINPMDIDYLAVFRPQRVVPRITRQGGLFTVHPNPTVELSKDSENVADLHKIIITKDYREALLSELSYYGINSATLFPDLDGLSMFINWTIEKKEYWNYPPNIVRQIDPPFG